MEPLEILNISHPFIFRTESIQGDYSKLTIQSITKPKFKLINNDVVWDIIHIKFYGDKYTSQLLYNFTQNKPTEFLLDIYNSENKLREQWIVNSFNYSIDFGKCDYNISESQMITMTISPLKCILN